MKDISYEILDLFRQYGSSPEGIRKALDSQSGPEVLHALSDIRENLLEWLDYTGCGEVLQIGSGYGVLTGLLASRCAHVAVMDEADENLAVNQERNKTYTNITYAIRQGMRQDSRSRHLTLWSWPDSEKARKYRTQLPLAPPF